MRHSVWRGAALVAPVVDDGVLERTGQGKFEASRETDGSPDQNDIANAPFWLVRGTKHIYLLSALLTCSCWYGNRRYRLFGLLLNPSLHGALPSHLSIASVTPATFISVEATV